MCLRLDVCVVSGPVRSQPYVLCFFYNFINFLFLKRAWFTRSLSSYVSDFFPLKYSYIFILRAYNYGVFQSKTDRQQRSIGF